MIKAILTLAALTVAGLLAFAIFSDLPPPLREVTLPVAPR